MGTRLVGLREVRHGELAEFGKAGVAVLGQGFVPIPHGVPRGGFHFKLIVETDFDNAVNIAQALLQFKVRVSLQPTLKRSNDFFFMQTDSARAAHCQYKGPTEFLVVVSVELVNFFKFFCGAVGEARFALLVGGLRC